MVTAVKKNVQANSIYFLLVFVIELRRIRCWLDEPLVSR